MPTSGYRPIDDTRYVQNLRELAQSAASTSEIEGYAHEVEAAKAELRAAWYDLLPSFSAGYSYGVGQQNLNGDRGRYQRLGQALEVRLVLFNGFSSIHTIRAREADLQVANEILRLKRNERALQASQMFVWFLSYIQSRRHLNNQIHYFEAFLKNHGKYLRASDRALVETELTLIKNRFEKSMGEIKKNRVTLENLARVQFASNFEYRAGLLPDDEIPPTYLEAKEEARRSPRLAIVDQRLRSQLAQNHAARARAFAPELGVAIRGGRNDLSESFENGRERYRNTEVALEARWNLSVSSVAQTAANTLRYQSAVAHSGSVYEEIEMILAGSYARLDNIKLEKQTTKEAFDLANRALDLRSQKKSSRDAQGFLEAHRQFEKALAEWMDSNLQESLDRLTILAVLGRLVSDEK